MNQSINTDSKNSKEPQQKYRLGMVSIKILGGLNRFYGRPTSPSASVMAQNIQLFGPRGGFLKPAHCSLPGDITRHWSSGTVNKIQKLSSFKSNENIHKREDGSYYVVSANKASSVTL